VGQLNLTEERRLTNLDQFFHPADEEKGSEGDDGSDESADEDDDDVSGDDDDDDVSGDDEAASGDEDDVIASGSGGDESGSEQEEDLDRFLNAVRKEKERRAPALRKEGVPTGKKGGVVVEDGGKQVRKGGKEKKGEKKSAKKELPFVIDAPQTLELFRAIVDGRSDAELALAVERIRACNSVNLAAENRRKMQVRNEAFCVFPCCLVLHHPSFLEIKDLSHVMGLADPLKQPPADLRLVKELWAMLGMFFPQDAWRFLVILHIARCVKADSAT
jgi:hypothetical protein